MIQNRLTREGKTLIITWQNALVEYQGRVLFAPEWGLFDMAVGSSVSSVFGGPADRQAYGETVDFVARRVSQPEYTDLEMVRHSNFQLLRSAREMLLSGSALKKEMESVVNTHRKYFPEDWLFLVEAYELMLARLPHYAFTTQLEKDLRELENKNEKFKELIEAGMAIAGALE
jgi:phenylalanine-4-hydroxylase